MEAWLASRVEESSAASTRSLKDCVEVREILDEAIDDVEEAFRINASLRTERELEMALLEVDVAKAELSSLREKYAILARRSRERESMEHHVRSAFKASLVSLLSRESKEARERARLKQAEEDASRVPVLEREISRCRRELETLKRREEDEAFILRLEDRHLLKIFSFLTAWNVLATAQTNRGLFARVDTLFGISSVKLPPPQRKRMNAGTAAAIASKLTASEIKGIIALDENARKLENECSVMRAEKEDLEAALSSTEAVKDFLAQKLRQTEADLADALATNAETSRQRKSDQEVILFLDARNRQLEADNQMAHQQCRKIKANANNDRDALHAQLEQLQHKFDQINRNNAHSDRNFKKQKGLLVKEVRTLRAQLDAVKRALSSTTGKNNKQKPSSSPFVS